MNLLLRSRSLFVLSAAAATINCGPDVRYVDARTQIMLRITSQSRELKERFTTLKIALARHDGGERSSGDEGWSEPAETLLPRAAVARWPIDLPIVPRNRADEFSELEVVVNVLAGEEVLAEARAVTTFEPLAKRVLELVVSSCAVPDALCSEADCHGRECLTCTSDGTCQNVGFVDPRTLPTLDSEEVLTWPDAGATAEEMLDPSRDSDDRSDSTRRDERDGGAQQTAVPLSDSGSESLDASAAAATFDASTGTSSVNPMPTCSLTAEEVCDGFDNDCDGQVDEGVKNACGGCVALVNQPEASCTAGAAECVATGVYKCDGPNAVVCDAKPKDAPTWYQDCDGDEYPKLLGSVPACIPPAHPPDCQYGWVRAEPKEGTTDCRDDDDNYYPGRTDGLPSSTSPDDYDLNCDGRTTLGASIFFVAEVQGQILRSEFPLCAIQLRDAPDAGAAFDPCEEKPCVVVSEPIYGGPPTKPLKCGEVSVAATLYIDQNVAGCSATVLSDTPGAKFFATCR